MKRLIVTGGSSGIGEAVVKLLSELYEVIIFDKDKPAVDCSYYKVDVTDPKSLSDAFAEVTSFDYLVHAAGIYIQKDLVDLTDDEITLQINVNLTGTAFVNKYALRHLNEGGVIINISSALGLVPEPDSPVYCATKAGINMLTKALAQQYAAKGVRINAILPGPVDTPLLRQAFKSGSEFAAYEASNPLGRIAKPSEIAHMIKYLLSEESSFITGACIPIDGGESSSSLYSPKKK